MMRVVVIVCCEPCWPRFHTNKDDSSPSHAVAAMLNLSNINKVNARLENDWLAPFNKVSGNLLNRIRPNSVSFNNVQHVRSIQHSTLDDTAATLLIDKC